MLKRAGAIPCVLVALCATSAEANQKMVLNVSSCTPSSTQWRQTDKTRIGRLTVTDQTGAVAYTQESVPFSTDQCLAGFTMSFPSALLARFINPDDPLFLTLEVCKDSATICPFSAAAVLDGHPVVFTTQSIDSVLPDIAKMDSDADAAALAVETTRAKAAELTLTNNLAGEVTRAKTAESTLTTNLSTEVNRATNAESTLTTNLSSEATRATNAENAENTRAKAAESTLTTNLSSEVTRATNAENAESMRAQAAEGILTANLATESGRASAAEGVLATNLSTESMRAQTAEGTLTANLATESGRAQTAEGTLTTNLATETQARIDGDTAAKAYADANFLNINNGGSITGDVGITGNVTITGDLTVKGVLHLNAGIAWDSCPPGLTAIQHPFLNSQNVTTNLLCASDRMSTPPKVPVADVLASYIAPICPMVNTVTQNYTTFVGPLAVKGINLLLGNLGTLLTTQVIPLGQGLLDAGTGFTNQQVAQVNVAVGNINSTLMTITTTINSAIAAYNALVGDVNGALSGVNSNIGGVVTGINSNVITPFNNNVDEMLQLSIDGANYVRGQVLAGVNSGVVAPFNSSISTTVQWSIDGANFVINQVNPVVDAINWVVIGPKDFNHLGQGLNGIMAWIQIYITEPLRSVAAIIGVTINNPPWAADPIDGIGNLYTFGTVPQVGNLDTTTGTLSSLGSIAHVGGLSYGGTAPSINHATLSALSFPTPIIPTLPPVTAPQIPAFTGFNLLPAVDFNQVAGAINSTFSPICATTQDAVDTATTYLNFALGNTVPALVPSFDDASQACGAIDAHVCTAAEIGIFTDATTNPPTTPKTMGFMFGDWAGDGRVILNDQGTTGLLLAVDWPFIHVDASKLLTIPPQWPFSFTPPVLPSGYFRCCASATAFN